MIASTKERRAFPRYPITFTVGVALTGQKDSTRFETECVDVSRSSIQISCDNQLIEALLAQEDYPHTAQLDFIIPGDNSPFSIFAQVVTHRRLSQNQFYLVLVFNGFHAGSDEQLADDLREFEPSGFRIDSAS